MPIPVSFVLILAYAKLASHTATTTMPHQESVSSSSMEAVEGIRTTLLLRMSVKQLAKVGSLLSVHGMDYSVTMAILPQNDV